MIFMAANIFSKFSFFLLTFPAYIAIIIIVAVDPPQRTIEDAELAEWSKAHDWKSCVG